MEKNRPIVVLGMARSGTSLVAGSLHVNGIWFYPHYPRKQNPKGDYVNPEINKILNKGNNTKKRILEAIYNQGYKDGFWGCKHDINLGLINIWNKTFSPVYVLVRRSPEDIWTSTLKMRVVKKQAISTEAAKKIIPYNRFLKQWQTKTKYLDKLNGFNIWPQKIIDGDFSELKDCLDFFGLELSEQKVNGFILKDSWHGGK